MNQFRQAQVPGLLLNSMVLGFAGGAAGAALAASSLPRPLPLAAEHLLPYGVTAFDPMQALRKAPCCS